MTLRGNLDSLQATEVLQLLTQSGKSGTLQVFDGHQTKLLLFEHGQLVYALHVEQPPPLGEVLFHRGLITGEELDERRDGERFDDEVSKAVARHRNGTNPPVSTSRPRLGEILVEQGRIRPEDLDYALRPETVPDELFERILVDHGLFFLAESTEVRQEVEPDVPLSEGFVRLGVLTRDEIEEALACVSDELLADLLAHHGFIKTAEAQTCAERLHALRSRTYAHFRIGEYLVARGRVSQRQLEKALGQQLNKVARLGDIAVEQGLITADELAEAEDELAVLRLEFSPLHPLLNALVDTNGFDHDYAIDLVMDPGEPGTTLAQRLVATGYIDDATLRRTIKNVLVDELSDLILWGDGSYEFFEGFSLQDALPHDNVGSLHAYQFEFSSLLLDAHYRVDELKRSSFRELTPHTILTAEDPSSVEHWEMTEADERLLARIDGRRPLTAVCQVMPGNSLANLVEMQRYLDSGWVTALTREEAYAAGQECVAAGDQRQAVLFYEHALHTEGEQPTSSRLQIAIREARLSVERSRLRRLALIVQKDVRCLAELPVIRPVLARLGRAGPAFDEFMIRKGLARQWWTVKSYVIHPVRRLAASRIARVVVAAGIVGSVLVALMMPGVPDVENPRDWVGSTNPPTSAAARPSAVVMRAPRDRIQTGGPVQTPATIHGDRAYFTSRDAMLRCVSLDGDAPKLEWQAELGEVGDILSQPAIAGDRVFVANVRGQLHAVSTDGAKRWTATFRRLEPTQPALIYASDNRAMAPACIAVAARECVVFVDPADGRELHRVATGNRVLAAPVGEGRYIYFGSADNHVYCLDWHARQIAWEREIEDDVEQLLSVDGRLLAVARGGSLVSFDSATGDVHWARDLQQGSIQGLRPTGQAQVAVAIPRGQVVTLDLISGSEIEQFTPPDTLRVDRVLPVAQGWLYATEDGHIGLLASGRVAWRSQDRLGRVRAMSAGSDHVAISTESGELELFSLKPEEAHATPPK